jgi:hypothetical protein
VKRISVAIKSYAGCNEPNDELINRHQERLGGIGIDKALTLIKRNVAGSFLWFVSFAVKRNEHPQAK